MKSSFVKLFLPSLKNLFILIDNKYATTMHENEKENLVQQIEEESAWLYARVIEKIVTINFSESMWEKVISEKIYPRAYPSFSEMGKAFAYISDSCRGTYLISRCGYGEKSDPDNMRTCLTSIGEWGDQYSFTINAENVKDSEIAYKLILGYISKFAMYLNDGPSIFWKRINTPGFNNVHLVINVDHNIKDASVKWNENKTTLTFSAPADSEAVEWKDKIEIGLRLGWTIM